jgi:peptidyl-prolyl cis-trans isomerase SurA
MTLRMIMKLDVTVEFRNKYGVLSLSIMLMFLFISDVARSAEVVDRIVAVVNDDIIRLVELNKAFEPIEKQIQSKGFPAEKEREIIYEERMKTLNNLVDDKLVDQKIDEAGITVKDSEIDSAIERIKSMNKYSQEDLELALTSSGLNLKDYREEVKKQILRNKLVNQEVTSNIVITHSDIQTYYDTHPDTYKTQKRYLLRNILMAYPAEIESRTVVRSRMDQVFEQLKNGAPFKEMAEDHSQAINSVDGGRLGFFTIDDMSDDIKAAVSPLKPGEFSSIIETENGFQIFYVEEIAETPSKSFNEASDEIRQKLYEDQVNEKLKTWIEQLKKEAHIKIMY